MSAGNEPEDAPSAAPRTGSKAQAGCVGIHFPLTPGTLQVLATQQHHLADSGKSEETARLANIPVDRVIPSSSVPTAIIYS